MLIHLMSEEQSESQKFLFGSLAAFLKVVINYRKKGAFDLDWRSSWVNAFNAIFVQLSRRYLDRDGWK